MVALIPNLVQPVPAGVEPVGLQNRTCVSLREMTVIYDIKAIGCRGRSRTLNLQIMNPVCYHYTTLQYIITSFIFLCAALYSTHQMWRHAFYDPQTGTRASLPMAPGVGIEPTGVSSQQISNLRPYDRLDNPADLV